MVIGRLFEFGADENLIKHSLTAVVLACPMDDFMEFTPSYCG
jgi:hypothetical protein